MTGRRVALLIATTEHIDESLRGGGVSAADCMKLRDLLLDADVGAFDEVALVVNESKAGIERELERRLRGCTPEDTVLLLVSGRAVWDERGQLFFATVGTDVTLPYSTAIPALVLRQLLAECPAVNKIVLADCGIESVLEHLGSDLLVISALTATIVHGLTTGEADVDNDALTALIAKLRARTSDTPEVQPELLDLLGFPDANFPVQEAWQQRPLSEMFRVPIGVDETGETVQLDIKISPDGGMGPHGMVVGADDAARIDFLRSVLGGLAATHSSYAMNFVLLDFSGEHTFEPLASLPHVSTLLTGGDEKFIGRLKDALAGEVGRRQELLHAGRFKSVGEYERARENGAQIDGERLDPLPALMIVVDGLSELVAVHPGFSDMIVTLGRLGKVLRIHMLLSSARLTNDDMRWLDAFTFYRVVLKTDTPAESRVVLGAPDAYELPRVAGAAYLKSDAHTMVRFTTATASRLVDESPDAPSVLDYVVQRVRTQGPPAHEVWLPPLDEPNPLDHLMPPLRIYDDRGLCPENAPWAGQLKAPVGIVDKPYHQRRDLLWADFSGEAGHGVVVGAARSGKSTLLQTVVMSMSLAHTPQEAQFYCLDYGGKLASLREIPNVVAVAAPTDHEFAQQILDLLSSLPDDHTGAAFLVVDGKPDGFEDTVEDLITHGLARGVHVILSVERWADIRPELRDMLGTRFELRLDDPAESQADPRVAVHVPARPGFGVTPEKLHFLAGLPRFDGSSSVADLDEATQAAAVRILQCRRTPFPDNELVRQRKRIPIGTGVLVDFQAEPHLLALGEPAGKTTLLRTVLSVITQRYTPNEATFLLVDYRRGLAEFAESAHLLKYAVTPDKLTEWTAEVVAALRERLPGQPLWTGPDLFVVVDDYDLVATQQANPLLPLREFLPVAREVGLHLIIASRSGGHPQDPIMAALKETVSPGVLMSASTPPGHAMMVTRESGQRPVQLTWTEPQR